MIVEYIRIRSWSISPRRSKLPTLGRRPAGAGASVRRLRAAQLVVDALRRPPQRHRRTSVGSFERLGLIDRDLIPDVFDDHALHLFSSTRVLQYNTGVDGKRRAGRTRDSQIDVRVLTVAKRHLAHNGYDGMSISAIALEAGTTRQALYRRWPTKADLAAAAVTSIEDPATPAVTQQDPLAALIAELQDFVRGASIPGRMSLVGAMLQDTADPAVVERYQAQVIAPRRERIMGILRNAQHLELIDHDADLDVAATMCTGSWYGRALAGDPPPPDWPRRAATLVWRAVGGR